MLRLTNLDHRLFGQGRGRAGLHAGAARDALGTKKAFAHTGRDAAIEPTSRYRQCEGALHFLASSHATRANDALRRIVGKVRVRLVLRHPVFVGAALGENVVLALIPITHVAQTDRASHILQFTIAVRSTGQAVKRMVGDIELHHTLAELLEAIGLSMNDETFHRRRGTGGRRAGAAFYLDKTHAAGAERIDHVGRAKLWDLRAHFHRSAHDRGAFGHRHALTVDGQGHHLLRSGEWRSVVGFVNERHGTCPYSAACRRGVAPKSSGKCFNALMTGYGVKPPSAHSEPNFMV